MKKATRTFAPKSLTPVELEIMSVLWRLERATVKEVQAQLPKERGLAYTTVATMMKILEGKGIVKSEKGDKAHTFSPLLKREEYAAHSLKNLTQKVFSENPTLLVKHLLEDKNLSVDDLKEIERLIKERLR